MQYMLLIHTDETAMREARAAAKGGAPEMMGAYRAYTVAVSEGCRASPALNTPAWTIASV